MPNRLLHFQQLREAYPEFIFENFTISHLPEGIRAEFHFTCGPELVFRPTVLFCRNMEFAELDSEALHLLMFHIGMSELISYWKAVCSPVIVIKPFRFTTAQEQWWKKLFRHGLGEFFFTNEIPIPGDEIFSFSYPAGTPHFSLVQIAGGDEGVMVPVGGGKDSVVALEVLSRNQFQVLPLVMNHREATRNVLKVGGYDDLHTFEIRRTLDPLILELNQKGFLNGHTPFSALLAFNALLAAALSGKSHIALSNEWSANEATIPGTIVNHQYSKSVEFEGDFREYVDLHLVKGINYFSFLRPLNELQIGKLFSGFEKYHPVFRSCNVGSKTDSWCCNCSKCLFTYIILAPFLEEQRLVQMFGENLWQNAALKNTLNELCGFSDNKPFECVGTTDEVKAALWHVSRNYPGSDLPVLLQHFLENAPSSDLPEDFDMHLKAFHKPHFLTEEFEKVLKGALHFRD